MNVDPRGFSINQQGVVAPKVTVFNGGKRRKTRKSNRKQKGGVKNNTLTVREAIQKLQAIDRRYGNLDLYKYVDDDWKDIHDIYYSDQGGWEKAVVE